MNEPEPGTQEPGIEEIKTSLENQGCVFHEKKEFEIPQAVDEGKLRAVFGEENATEAKDALFPAIRSFLTKAPITDTDRFGSDPESHKKRRVWRMELSLAERVYYEGNNQLRLGGIFPIAGILEVLSGSARGERGQLVKRFSELFNREFNGDISKYTEMTTEQRLEFLKKWEPRFVWLLNLFAPDKPEES